MTACLEEHSPIKMETLFMEIKTLIFSEILRLEAKFDEFYR